MEGADWKDRGALNEALLPYVTSVGASHAQKQVEGDTKTDQGLREEFRTMDGWGGSGQLQLFASSRHTAEQRVVPEFLSQLPH